MEKTIYKSRLRTKGQVTVPPEIRNLLGAEEGDDLLFYTDVSGRVVVSRAQVIDPEQTWFWSERWQRQEREVQQDIEKNTAPQFDSSEEALNFLHQASGGKESR